MCTSHLCSFGILPTQQYQMQAASTTLSISTALLRLIALSIKYLTICKLGRKYRNFEILKVRESKKILFGKSGRSNESLG